MRYTAALEYDDERFRRLTGVRKRTFQEMLELLTEAHGRKKARGGRPNKLQISEMLMMTLEYLREYRTYFHIGASYGLSHDLVTVYLFFLSIVAGEPVAIDREIDILSPNAFFLR